MRTKSMLYGLAALVLAANLVVGWRYQRNVNTLAGEDAASQSLGQFTKVLDLVRHRYYDETLVSYPDLINGGIAGMLSTLDPFSGYIPPKQYQNMNEMTTGHFGGIGVQLTIEDGKLVVLETFAGSPGTRAGIMANDVIVAVEGKAAAGLGMHDVVDMIKGELGTPVRLSIFRPSTGKTMDLTMNRAIVEINSVRHVQMVTPQIGYLQITEFSEKTPDEVLGALQTLIEQDHMQGLIIDLRDNPGGLLLSANAVCSLFLSTGDLISYTEGRYGQRLDEAYVPEGFHMLDKPVVILQNGNSASGAEVVAGCLQDNKRATLVGTKSYGKGSVQNIFPMEGGGAVKLTIAHYYTPSARIIHHNGIPADVEVPLEADAEQRARAMRIDGRATARMLPGDDAQLAAGINVLNEKLKLPLAVFTPSPAPGPYGPRRTPEVLAPVPPPKLENLPSTPDAP